MEFLQRIDVGDVLDVAIVAMLLYAGLIWFKRTRALLVLVGIVILGVVYAAARFLNLYLTTAILQGFFAVLLIAIIVIFQEELRRFFERVAVWGLRRRPPPPAAPVVDILARTAADLARARTGAILVIAGHDPLERHLEGGQSLGGALSEPLLQSLFDPHSPGHDGAAIIAGGEIVRFACHLPLSKDMSKLAGRGTRHAAALGLSERTDALCIVVSEERGTITVMRDGAVEELASGAELLRRIEDYLAERFPPHEKHRLINVLRVNRREKIAALLLAIGLWAIFAQGAGIMQRDFVVPIEYVGLPSHLNVEQSTPRRLIVTLSGDERTFKLLEPEVLKATINLEQAQPGRLALPIRRSDIARIPRGLEIEAVRPPAVDLILGVEQRK